MSNENILKAENAEASAKLLLKKIADKYGVENLSIEMDKENSTLYKKDIFICLKNIINAVIYKGSNEEEKLEALKKATNIYNAPIFGLGFNSDKFLIKHIPDFQKVIDSVEDYKRCLDMNIYNIVNTVLAIVKAQITGYDLKELFAKGIQHVRDFIKYSLKNNPNWNEHHLQTDDPKLIMPIGAAGCGKSTFYKELKNVVNLSCDNIRYLLFKEYGPCFASWESSLSWWVVNSLVDYYINHGFSVFYNGVNTDMEYRSPMSMEIDDPIFEGLKYKIVLVYFEPPVKLSDSELKELKNINLWEKQIDDLDFSEFSDNVAKIMSMIKNNYKRTLTRTEAIRNGKEEQDEFDILYSVPPAIVKLFAEQSFDKPEGKNVVVVPRKEIPDPEERTAFYKSYADKVLSK